MKQRGASASVFPWSSGPTELPDLRHAASDTTPSMLCAHDTCNPSSSRALAVARFTSDKTIFVPTSLQAPDPHTHSLSLSPLSLSLAISNLSSLVARHGLWRSLRLAGVFFLKITKSRAWWSSESVCLELRGAAACQDVEGDE